MQVETSTNIKQSWSIRLHYQTTIISVSFSIFRTPYSSLALLSYSKSEQSCLSSIPIPFFFFFFSTIQEHFLWQAFQTNELAKSFFKLFRWSIISGFQELRSLIRGNTDIFMYFYICVYVCIYIWKSPLCSFPQRQRLVCSWCSIKPSIFRPLGHTSLSMAGYFLAREKSPNNNIRWLNDTEIFKILSFPTAPPTK